MYGAASANVNAEKSSNVKNVNTAPPKYYPKSKPRLKYGINRLTIKRKGTLVMYLGKLINAIKRLPFSLGVVGAIIASLVVTSTSVAGQGLLIGQEHSYDVYVRGNGEALVAARVVVNNTQEQNMETVTLETPDGVSVSELHAAQELRPPKCIDERNRYRDDEECQEFRPPDYSNAYSYRYNSKFQRVSIDESNGAITVELKEAIEPNTNGAFLLSFVTRDFVDTSAFGNAFNFNAKSLKADQRITKASMAVYADTDYRIRGAESDVDYASVTEGSRGLQSASPDSAVESSTLQNFSRRVGRQGQVNKTAQALAPGDVMEVDGFAAQSWWRLNLVKLLIIGLIAAGVIAGLVYWWRRSGASGRSDDEHGRNHEPTEQKKKPAESQTTHPQTARNHGRLYIISILLGLVSALAVMGVSALLLNMEDLFSRRSELLSMLQVLAVIAAYLFVFLAPPIFAGIRYGLRWGLLTVGISLLWMVLLVAILSALFTDSGGVTPPPPRHID